MSERWQDSKNQSSYRCFRICLRNTVLHRGTLLRSRDDCWFIFRQILTQVIVKKLHRQISLLTSDCVFVILDFQGISRGHHEKHPDPDDIVVSNQQGAVLHHPSSHTTSGENHTLLPAFVSDPWTWGEVKFIMATFNLNLNRHCNPFIRWNYLFYYAYSSNFHANRTDVVQFFHIVKAVLDQTSTTSRFQFHKWFLYPYRIRLE